MEIPVQCNNPGPSRREFLIAAAMGVATAAQPEQARRSPVIDCHTHVALVQI